MSLDDEDSGPIEQQDDKDFMEQVNVYLNERESSMEGKSLEGILRRDSSFSKSVKFAIDEEEREEEKDDSEKTRQDLLSKIARLKDMLRDAEQLVVSERDKRKKKEKNLLKLAKELKKRNAQKESDLERLEELEEKKQYLEHHWVLAGKELDQEKLLRQKLQSEQHEDFQRAIREEKEKFTQIRQNSEQQISELKRDHSRQCDELGKEILKANLEADRLHNQLNGAPRQTKLFSKDKSFESISFGLILFSMVAAVIAFAGYKVNLFTMDGVCSPAMPGITLGRANAGLSYEAPWWVPASYKAKTFEKLCSPDHPPTVLQWLPDGKDNRLILTQGQKVIVKKNAVVKAEIYGDRLRTWNKKGLAEEHQSLWYA